MRITVAVKQRILRRIHQTYHLETVVRLELK